VDAQKLENTVANMLSGFGLNEIMTNSVTQSQFEQQEEWRNQSVKLLNSQTAELDSLRTDLMYSGLEVITYNQNRKHADLRLYEFGKTYHREKDGVQEQRHLSIWLTGKTRDDNWMAKGEKYSFYHLKSLVTNVLQRLGHTAFENEYFESIPYRFGLHFKNEDQVIARIVAVDQAVLQKFEIKQDVFYADLNWNYLLEKSAFNKISFSELPKFPAVRRDLAMVINADLKFAAIEEIAFAESKKLLQEVSLFDVYKGDKIESGKKSYAVSYVFQHPERTLTDVEVDKVVTRLMNKYENELGAIIRKR
jgi:phenylalanyl-tRNA synthetase beta chain